MNDNPHNRIPSAPVYNVDSATFTIWCDGAYCGGLNMGAWGAVIVPHGKRKVKHSGFLGECINNMHAELASIVESLKLIPEESHVTVMNDCVAIVELAQKGHSTSYTEKESCPKWAEDYTYLLDALSLEMERLGKVDIQWVKGHSTDLNNRKADKLAKKALNDNARLPDYSIDFDPKKHPYWKSYTDQISQLLGKNGFALKPGDAGFLSKKMCIAGLIDANRPCNKKHPHKVIPIDNLLQLAEQMSIRKFPERISPKATPHKRMGMA